jgi:hypothetical protein
VGVIGTESDMNNIAIGVIGAGLIGRKHLRKLAEHRDYDLVGIADVNVDAVSAEHPKTRVFADYRHLLDEARPEAVIIASPNQMHAETGIECARRGIHILIENHINAFNTHNTELFLSVFGNTAIIVDGIAPYLWLNPNAPANWLADVEKWRENLGVTYEHLSYEMGFWNVEGAFAYAVISTLTVTIKGQAVVRTGTLAYTFGKADGVWKIEAQL